MDCFASKFTTTNQQIRVLQHQKATNQDRNKATGQEKCMSAGQEKEKTQAEIDKQEKRKYCPA
jgi:hypothetical protein